MTVFITTSTKLTLALKTRFLVKKYTSIRVETVANIRQDNVFKMVLACLSIYRTPLAVNSRTLTAEYIVFLIRNNSQLIYDPDSRITNSRQERSLSIYTTYPNRIYDDHRIRADN